MSPGRFAATTQDNAAQHRKATAWMSVGGLEGIGGKGERQAGGALGIVDAAFRERVFAAARARVGVQLLKRGGPLRRALRSYGLHT